MADVDNIKVAHKKTTVREEFEYWNAIYLFRRLNLYYRNRLRYKIKDLQGLESNDFAMRVLEKIVAEDVSWERSARVSFIDFVYDVARGELSHFVRDNKERTFISYDALKDRGSTTKIKDSYYGF